MTQDEGNWPPANSMPNNFGDDIRRNYGPDTKADLKVVLEPKVREALAKVAEVNATSGYEIVTNLTPEIYGRARGDTKPVRGSTDGPAGGLGEAVVNAVENASNPLSMRKELEAMVSGLAPGRTEVLLERMEQAKNEIKTAHGDKDSAGYKEGTELYRESFFELAKGVQQGVDAAIDHSLKASPVPTDMAQANGIVPKR
jgi:hypothetical protein